MPWRIIANVVGVAILALVIGTPQGRRQLASAAAIVTAWMMHTTFRIAPTIAVVFAKGLLTSFETNRGLWAQVVNIFLQELTGQTLTVDQLRAIAQGGSLGQTAGAAFKPLIDGILGVVAPPPPLTTDSGQAGLRNTIGLTTALSLQGWYIEAVGDLVSLGKFGSAADLPDAVERALGLNRLGRLIWRTPVKKAIAEPLEEAYNRSYQFKKLTLGEARQLWHRGLIDDATFIDIAQAAGYNHERAALLLELGKQPYDLAQIRDMDRLLSLNEGLLLDLLAEHGYTGGRGLTVLTLMRAKDRETVLRELANEARKLYRVGRLTQAQLEAILGEAHFPADEVSIILAAEDLSRAEAKTLTAGEVQQAFRAHAIDGLDARRRLRQLGYQDQDVDVLLGTHRREPSVAQIVELLVRARITAEEARRRLVLQGYSEADAELIVSLRGRRLSEGQIIDALREGLINAQQARTDLAALGFDPNQADILLAFIRRTLSPADVQAALLRGLLTEPQALERLRRAGYDQADAQLIIDLRRRLLRIGDILNAFEDGFITRVDAFNDLQQRGFSRDDAETIVRVFELHLQEQLAKGRPPTPPRPPAPPRQPPPSGGRRGTGGTPPSAPPP